MWDIIQIEMFAEIYVLSLVFALLGGITIFPLVTITSFIFSFFSSIFR